MCGLCHNILLLSHEVNQLLEINATPGVDEESASYNSHIQGLLVAAASAA
jgi:hypothetical protein